MMLMYVRLMTAQVHPGKIEEALRLYHESVGPAIRGQPGFKSALLLIDRNTCKSITLILWESEADLRAGEASNSFQQQIAQVAHVFSSTPAREVYEVSALA